MRVPNCSLHFHSLDSARSCRPCCCHIPPIDVSACTHPFLFFSSLWQLDQGGCLSIHQKPCGRAPGLLVQLLAITGHSCRHSANDLQRRCFADAGCDPMTAGPARQRLAAGSMSETAHAPAASSEDAQLASGDGGGATAAELAAANASAEAAHQPGAPSAPLHHSGSLEGHSSEASDNPASSDPGVLRYRCCMNDVPRMHGGCGRRAAASPLQTEPA